MTAAVIQGAFLGGQPRFPSIHPRSAPPPLRVPPPIQAKSAARPPAPAFAGHPPGPPSPAFAARPPGPPAPAFAARAGAVQRQGAGGAFAVEAGALGLASSGGRPLPDSLRGKMEAALGADFSTVRVHVGPQAERIGAIAFTLGSDIYFAPGRYQPDTVHGQQLLGHELAHVVQQRAGRVKNPLGSGLAVVQDHALEAEADRLGRHAAAHRGAVQAKMPPGATAQPSAPVRISLPVSAGPGGYRLTAGVGGREVGSVTVHPGRGTAVEVTHLGVAEGQRGHGIGRKLIASAAMTALQYGKSKVTLAAQDKGSGRLTQWYREMGFAQIGVNQRGYPHLEAPIGRLIAGVSQRKTQFGELDLRAPEETDPHSVGIALPRLGFSRWGRGEFDAQNRRPGRVRDRIAVGSVRQLGGGLRPNPFSAAAQYRFRPIQLMEDRQSSMDWARTDDAIVVLPNEKTTGLVYHWTWK